MSQDLTKLTDGSLVAPSAFDDLVVEQVDDDVTLAARRLLTYYDNRYAAVLRQSQTLGVDIPKDPVSAGLNSFNSTLALARHAANQVAPWLSNLVADKNAAYERYKKAKAAYEEKLDLMFANDPEVQEIKGVEAKKIHVRNICERDARIVNYAEQIWRRISAYHDALKLIYDNLTGTSSDLMKQLAVVKQQIALGEINPNDFPTERGGVSPPTSGLQRAEADIASALDAPEGPVTI
jgi:hypothetical protein